MKVWSILAIALLGLCGCTIVPNEIQVHNPDALVSFEELISKPIDPSQVGSEARWGGMIVDIQRQDGVAILDVLYLDQSKSGRPVISEYGKGRFKAIIATNEDTSIFEHDRLITIVGEVGEARAGLIDGRVYTYPTINAQRLHVWSAPEYNEDYMVFMEVMPDISSREAIWDPWYGPRSRAGQKNQK
jgi:outer membrane lipoprotein